MVVDYKRNKAHVAQQAEQGFCKPQVGSSILSMGSNTMMTTPVHKHFILRAEVKHPPR